ncbi:ZmpA/ZmpB/ZmpC family metallo-endopeptidase [Streptococcus pluranimalium]|uniref:ZmpA/ZmpB/ZmpC family metallo-endopeptidase n=1 Tax=Streptococcus pluranimalium TaxID=82348 RepID=UPI0039FCFB5E
MERKQKFSIKKLSVGVVSVCIGFAWSTQTVQADGIAEKPLSNQEHAKGVADLANESPQIPEVTAVVVRNQALPTESAEAKSYATNMADSVISENPENATFKLKASVEESASPALVVSGEARELAEAPKPVSEPSNNALNETTRIDDKPRLRRTRDVRNEESLEGAVTKDVSEKDGEIALVDDMAETAKSPKRQVRALANRKERYQTVLDELKQQNKTTYDSLSPDEKDRISNALVTEFQDHFIENVLPGIKAVTDYKEISRDPNFKLGSPKYLEMIRTVGKEGVPPKDLIKTVNERLVAEYNRTLTSDITVDGYVIQNPDMMVDLVKSVMVGQNLDAIWSSKRPVLQGMYLLNMQYNFEENLPSKIVNQDRSMMLDTTIPKVSAFDNIKRIGNYEQTYLLKAKGDYAGLLLRYQDFFRTQIQPVIGGNSTLELVEKLAGQMSLDNYVQNRSKALMPESDLSKQEPRNTADLLHRLNLLIPVLSQGEGAVVGSTRDTVTLGIKAVYPDVLPRLSTGAQPDLPKMVQNLNQFENYNTFLREASRYGTDKSLKTAAPLIARDSLMTREPVNGQDQRVWQSLATNDTVRNLIAPLKFDSPSYDVRSFIEGEKASQNLFNSFTIPLLDGSSRGPGLYSHEMTHANDQEVLFDKPYGKGGRREGQGPELYARGLFEARDNTQTSASGNVDPVFNLNTTIIPTNGKNDANIKQIQPSEALNTPQKLADYQHKLMKLIMWMEAKEAQVALKILNDDQKKQYFNQVEQVARRQSPANGADAATTTSTNDKFVPSTKAPQTITDLVTDSYVSAGFIQSGANRFGEVSTNSYNFLSLLDSFYGSNYAPADKNTVGDLSFKRNAHEILGYQGYEAMIAYLSDRFNSDQAFYADLKRTFDAKTDVLAGQTQATPIETKVKQYEELLKLELQNVPEELKTIYTDKAIEDAILKDLKAVTATGFPRDWTPEQIDAFKTRQINNVRNLKLTLLSRIVEESDTMNSDPTKQNLFKRTYTTRYVFVDEQRRPLDALALNRPEDKEQQSVRSEAPANPDTTIMLGNKVYSFLEWEAPQENTTNPSETIITYTGVWKVTDKTPTSYNIIYVSGTGNGNGETPDQPLNNLNDAILKVRDGGTIRLVGDYSSRNVGSLTVNKALTIDSQTSSSLNLNESLTFNKPVTLTGNLQIFSVGNGGQSVPLTFNADVMIDQDIRTHNPNGTGSKPTVVLNAANATIKGGEFEKLVTSGSSTATISDSAKLSQGVETNDKATITYATNQTNRFKAISGELNLIFSGKPANLTLENVTDVTLLPKAAVSLAPNATIRGHVSLHNDAILRAQDNTLTFSKLTGPGTLSFDEARTLTVSTLLENPTIEVISQTGRYQDKKIYVYAESGDARVLAKQLDEILEKTPQNDYRYLEPYHIYHEFKASEAKNNALFRADDFRHLLPENDGDISLTEPKTPALITETVVSNNKKWVFKKWLLKKDHNDKTYVFFGLWEPQDLVAPKESRQITYEFAIRGATEERFRAENIVKPADQLVLDGEKVSPPTTFDNQVRASQDQSGEWQFKGWNPPGEQLVSGPLTFTGTWEFVPYKPVDFPITYEADQDREAGTDNVIKIPGILGKQSGITDKVVVPPTRQLVTVGTKPKVEVKEAATIPVTYVRDDAKEANVKTEISPGRPEKTTIRTTFEIVGDQAVPKIIETTEPATPKVVSIGTKPKVEVKVATTIPVTYVRDDAKEANVKTEVSPGHPEKTTIRTTFDIVGDKAVPKITETTDAATPTTISVGTKPLVTEEISKIRLTFVANEQDPAGRMVITDVGSQTRTKVTTPYKLVDGIAVLDEFNKQTVVYEGSPRIVTVGTKPVTTQISQDLAEKVVEDSNVLAGTPDKVTPGRPKLTEIRKTYTLNKDTGKVVEKVEEVIVDAGLAPERIVGTKAMVINPITPIRQPKNYQISYRYRFENGQETNFDVPKAPLPSGKTVAENETISVPNLYTNAVIESKDATGEWQFKGWTPANEQVVSGPLTFTGTWEYKAYTIVEPSVRYEANDQLAFASQPVTTLGQSGKVSAFTGRLVENPTDTVIQVGTKPLIQELVGTDIPVRYIADDNIETNKQVTRIEGSPAITTTQTTYRLDGAKAVVNQTTTLSTKPAVAKEIVVGTKPKVTEKVGTVIPKRYTADDEKTVNVHTVISPGKAEKTITTTTYRLDDKGQAVVANERVTVEAAVPEVISVGTKPLIQEIVGTDIPIRYVADDNIETNKQVTRIEGSPAITTTQTTYRLDGAKAVVNQTTTLSTKPAVAKEIVVGTKPKVTEKVGTVIPKRYTADDEKTVNVHTVISPGKAEKTITTTTYRLDDKGQAVVADERVTVEAAVPEVISVGTKPLIQEIVGTDIPIRYVADDNIETNKQVTRIEGSPAITTTQTTYRLDGAKAVVDQTTALSTKPAVAKEIVVGTKPKLVRQEEMLSEVVEYDANTLAGSPDQVIPGRPKVTETRTHYSVDEQTGALSEQVTTVVTDQGLAPKRIIASKALTLAPIPSPTVPTIPQPSKDVAESYTIVVSVDGKEVQVSTLDDVVYAVFLEHLSALIEAKLSEGLVYDSAINEDNTVHLFFHHPMDDQSSGDANVVSPVNPPVENYEITILIDGQLAQISTFDLMTHAVFLEHLSALIEVKLSEGLTYVSADYKGKAVTLSFIRPKKVTKGTAEAISFQSSSADQSQAAVKPTLAVKDAFKKEMALKQHDEKSLLKGGSAAAGGSNQGESALLSSKNSQGTPLTWRNGTFSKPNQALVMPTYQAMLPKTGASNRHLLAVGGLTLTGLTFMFISLKRRQS